MWMVFFKPLFATIVLFIFHYWPILSYLAMWPINRWVFEVWAYFLITFNEHPQTLYCEIWRNMELQSLTLFLFLFLAEICSFCSVLFWCFQSSLTPHKITTIAWKTLQFGTVPLINDSRGVIFLRYFLLASYFQTAACWFGFYGLLYPWVCCSTI